jgi:hypothetical protein
VIRLTVTTAPPESFFGIRASGLQPNSYSSERSTAGTIYREFGDLMPSKYFVYNILYNHISDNDV